MAGYDHDKAHTLLNAQIQALNDLLVLNRWSP